MMTQSTPNWQNTPPAFLGNSSSGKGVNSGLKRVPRSPKLNSGFNPNIKGGFNPAVLILENIHKTPRALIAMRCRGDSEIKRDGKNSRLLLIASNTLDKPYSKVSRKRPTKKKRKVNRKCESKKGSFRYQGMTYKVNTGNGEDKGIYLDVVRKMIGQLNICLDMWGRVYAVRLDLHQKFYRGDNKLMSRFICNFRKAMLKEYGFNDFGYQWARELETSKACHYHLVIFFDGYKIKSHWKIRQLARYTWERIKVGNTVPYWKPKKYGKVAHDIRKNDHEALLDAVEHFSYLAKTRGKGYRDKQAKDYSTSRIPKRVRIPA